MKIFRLNILVAILMCISSLIEIAHAQNYSRYCNERFGFCVDYPKYFKMEPPPTNGDGRILYDGDKLKMIVSGSNNFIEAQIVNDLNPLVSYFDKVTYRASGDNWIVLSGFKGNHILYIKKFYGEGSSNELRIEYSTSHQKEYSEIVTRISRSFKPGNISEPQ